MIDELDQKLQVAIEQLGELEAASESAWSEMQPGFIAAYHDLRDAAARAKESFENS